MVNKPELEPFSPKYLDMLSNTPRVDLVKKLHELLVEYHKYTAHIETQLLYEKELSRSIELARQEAYHQGLEDGMRNH